MALGRTGFLFGDPVDADDKRKEIVWIAILFIVVLASWLLVALFFGFDPLARERSYEETVLFVGLAVVIVCSVTYIATRERDARHRNKRLLADLRQAIANLDERVRRLNSLCTTSTELAGALDLDRISDLVVSALTEQVQASASSLILVDRETGQPVYAHHAGEKAPEASAQQEHLAHLVRQVDRPLRLPEPDSLDDTLSRQLDTWHNVKSLISAPLRAANGVSGLLDAHRYEGQDHFTLEDLNLLTTLANMAAKAIESAQLHQELKESYLCTLRTLTNSLGARDHYTASHGERVTRLACRLAEQLGLPEGIIEDIHRFGPLHDLGKIGVPDEILLKPAPLTPREREICQEHCTLGEQILKPLKPSAPALAMIRNHHERWDGRGYPDGLAGEQIPILARVLNLADAFDALISDRPYQPPLSDAEALAHIRLQAGRQFDPSLVEALARALGEAEPEPTPERATKARTPERIAS